MSQQRRTVHLRIAQQRTKMTRFLRSLFTRKVEPKSFHLQTRHAKLHVERKNVKHARIMVHHDGQVRFIAPLRYSEERIHQLVEKHSPWIVKQQHKFSTLARIELGSHDILYRGKIYHFVQKTSLGEQVLLYPHHKIVCSGVNLMNAKTLEFWYKSEALRIFKKRVEILSQRFDLPYARMRVTSPKTIWGSCTCKHVVSFNWRLIKAPSFVLDYLIIHELVHTKIPDHSSRFWKRVSELCPRYEEAVEWLKSYGRWI